MCFQPSNQLNQRDPVEGEGTGSGGFKRGELSPVSIAFICVTFVLTHAVMAVGLDLPEGFYTHTHTTSADYIILLLICIYNLEQHGSS